MEAIKHYLYKKSLLKQQQASKKNIIKIKGAKHIGILFNASDIENREKVVSYSQKLKKEGYQVKMLGYLDQKTESITFPFDYFTIKDVNFYYVPKNNHIEHFLSLDLDILMNLDLSNVLPIHYLAAASNAAFKVGALFEGQDQYHLMIETSGKNNLDAFITETSKTLNKIE